jgi:hypothetical protein
MRTAYVFIDFLANISEYSWSSGQAIEFAKLPFSRLHARSFIKQKNMFGS